MIKTYSDFLQLIAESDIKGYRVCFESSTKMKEEWAGRDYFDYLGTIERHKQEKGYTTQYESICDGNNRITDVDVLIHMPEERENELPERYQKMHWVIKYDK